MGENWRIWAFGTKIRVETRYKKKQPVHSYQLFSTFIQKNHRFVHLEPIWNRFWVDLDVPNIWFFGCLGKTQIMVDTHLLSPINSNFAIFQKVQRCCYASCLMRQSHCHLRQNLSMIMRNEMMIDSSHGSSQCLCCPWCHYYPWAQTTIKFIFGTGSNDCCSVMALKRIPLVVLRDFSTMRVR